MKHYVYLKFPGEKVDSKIYDLMERTIQQVYNEIDGFQAYQIIKSKQKLAETCSVLIELTFIDQHAKDFYLAHPLHRSMLQQIKNVIIDKAVFDT